MKGIVDRRSALKNMCYLVGGAVATPTLISVLQSCRQAAPALDWQPKFLSSEQAALTSELTELILPATGTPGAKEAGVPLFIDSMLEECLSSEAQSMFLDGLTRVEDIASTLHKKEFLKLDLIKKTEVLTQIAREDHNNNGNAYREIDQFGSFFSQLKELTLIGYFNSEAGAQQALAYLQIPGAYNGCTTLEPGQKAWAID